LNTTAGFTDLIRQIWDIFEGRHLFYGIDPEHRTYRTHAHLAEIIAVLGPPPPSLVARGLPRSKFFSDQGQPLLLCMAVPDVNYSPGEFQSDIKVPHPVSLEQLETNLEDADKQLFMCFIRKMLQWDPQNRHTAKQLLEDEWLKKHT
jgi:serine/threonine protein kinase